MLVIRTLTMRIYIYTIKCMKYRKVIFIDEENTRLSPFTAVLFRKKMIDTGLALQSASRGTVVLFPEPANQKVADLAIGFGVTLQHHRATMLSPEDFSEDTLMLALDSTSKKRAFDIQTGMGNIYTLKEYVGESGDLRLPLGEPKEKYETVCENIDRLLNALADKLIEEESIYDSNGE